MRDDNYVVSVLQSHARWFGDMQIDTLSDRERAAFPEAMRRVIEVQLERERWRQRTIVYVGIAGAIGNFVGGFVSFILTRYVH